MHRPEPLELVGVDIRTLVRPKATSVKKSFRKAYIRRCRALEAVAGGTAPTRAAELHEIDPRTVESDAILAMTLHDDGQLVGFRACLPFRRKKRKARGHREVQHKRGAHSMTRLLDSDARIGSIVDGYGGGLPNGHRKNRRFDRMMAEFRKAVREVHGEDVFLFHQPDRGRRAVLEYLKRKRRAEIDNKPPDESDTPPRTQRLSQVVHDEPLDRIEFDAHKEDVDWVLRIPAPNNAVAERKVERVTLLAAVCAASRFLMAMVLVLGEYNRLDVLRLINRMLRPWKPRDLIVPGLAYQPGARIGLLPQLDGSLPRGLVFAGDNARQHHALIAVDNFIHRHRGMYHRGPAHVPEVRAFAESFFAMIENGALRMLPGGFQPSRTGEGKTRTSYARAEDHPLQWLGMLDLMDVIGANYNVTNHNGHGIYGRRPLDVMDEHLASRWTWCSSDPERDARLVTTTTISRTVRGAGRVPYIEYEGAHYRSQKLMAARHLVNQTVTAEVNIEDLRELILLGEDGAPWSRLEAQPPWHRTPHDLHMRQQINRTRHRGLFSIAGVEDAIAAYAAYARAAALDGSGSVASYARAEQQLATGGDRSDLPPPARPPAPPVVLHVPGSSGGAPTSIVISPGSFNPAPRHGRASFANVRR